MAVVKVLCPECHAALRQPIDPVAESTQFTVSCPKCGHTFVAEAQPQKQSRTHAGTKHHRDEDDEPEAKSRTALIIAVAVAALLVIGGTFAVVVGLGGKDKETA